MMRKVLRVIYFFCAASFLLADQACQKSVSTDQIVQNESQNQPAPKEMILIDGGSFQMGASDGMPFESPVHAVEIKSFLMDEHEVTVRQFAEFAEATNYRTDAEKFGWSGVFNQETGEWEKSDGADWRHPDGADSTAKADEPVCQISWTDANAYAKWAGKRLPTEAEFEYASRGGLQNKKYAWGDELAPDGKFMANYWQGDFPVKNTGADGFLRRAPVKSFPPNGYGLYDTTGNVWEWNSDWYADDYYENSPKSNPTGAANGAEKVIRGGSFLCAGNFCTNYRVAGRSHSTPDSGLNNLGFRCARDVR